MGEELSDIDDRVRRFAFAWAPADPERLEEFLGDLRRLLEMYKEALAREGMTHG